jgi:hypothetical protein
MVAALLIGATFGLLSATAAVTRGRHPVAWFLAGVLVGPFGLIVAFLPLVPRAGVTLACPNCGEVIRASAASCRHCGQLFVARPERGSRF